MMKISNSIIVQYKTTSNIPTITKYYARTTYARVGYAYITTLYTAVQLQTIFRDSQTYTGSPHLTLPPSLGCSLPSTHISVTNQPLIHESKAMVQCFLHDLHLVQQLLY